MYFPDFAPIDVTLFSASRNQARLGSALTMTSMVSETVFWSICFTSIFSPSAALIARFP